MRKIGLSLALLSGILLVTGCRFKGVESFEKSTTPVDYAQEKVQNGVKGDPYANGGIAYATAGKKVHTRYGTGADVNSSAAVDPKLDQPQKGSGQQAGEQGGDSATGTGKSNAPANQPSPSVEGTSNH